MKKNRIAFAAVLCTMMIAPMSVNAQEITDFTNLKKAIEEATSPVDVTTTGEIGFTETLDISKKVSISGTNSSSLSPGTSTATFKKNAFNVESGGELTLKDLTIKNFGDKSEMQDASVVDVKQNGKLHIGPNVTFNNNVTSAGTPPTFSGATINNAGIMDIETAEGQDVKFEYITRKESGRDEQYDIEMGNGSSLTIKGEGGTVTFSNGISSVTNSDKSAQITHSGNNEVVLKGKSTYDGTFTNESGTFTVANDIVTFFGGKSEFKGGHLKWETDQYKLISGAQLIVDGADLTVGNGTNNASLNISGNNSIEKAKNITIQKLGELILGKNTTFNAANGTSVKGSGKLTLSTGKTLSLIGQVINENADSLVFSSQNATVNIKDVEDDGSELSVIVGEKANNDGLTLNLENYKGTDKVGVNVDGKAITQLNFSGKNVYNQGSNCDITISVPKENDVAGVMTNKKGADTTIHGNVNIGETGKTYTKNPTLVNEEGATLTIDAGSTGLINAGKVENNGKLTATSIGNEGTIESLGSLTADRLINSGSVNSTNSFTVNETVSNSGTITGINATFGTYNGSGSIDSLNLSGDLTITGEDGEEEPLQNAISNDGEIKARNIKVEKGSVSNNGTITVSDEEGNTYGDITVNNGGITNGTSASITAQNVKASGNVENSSNIEAKGTLTVGGTLTANSGSSTKMAGGSLNDVTMNGGTVTNSGELSIGGAVTGSGGSIENSGNLTLTGDGSGFTGKFTQSKGSTTVKDSGKLFNGQKQINGGSLTVTADSMNWTGAVELGSSTTFDFTGTTKSTISDTVLKFTGSGATANFNGTGGYSLSDKFNGSGNNLTFTGTTVTLDGTDYSKAGTITLNNSNLNLHDADTAQYKDYVFEDFVSNGGSVDLDLQIVNENQKLNEGYLKSDTLTFNSGSGTLSVGKLYIDNKAQNGVDSYTTKDHVIKGAGNVNFDGSSVGSGNITWSSNSFVYDVQASGKDITLSNGRAASENALNDMNILAGERQFQTENEYSINKDLDATENGKFNVFGKNKNNKTDSLKGNGNRFFNIGKDKTTELHIDDLTISGASSSDGGSVLKNESADSKVFINKSDISGNTSTGGKGGAIYNNGGSGIDPKDESNFTGLYVGNTTFENNTATGKGGAIYNDENGFLYLENVTTAKATGEGQNDIYNAGTTYTNGENTFNSLFTNDGNVTFQGQNTLSEFVNNATAIVNSGNAQIDSYSSTKGTLNLNSGTNATLGTVTGDVNSSITNNNGNLTLTGNGAGYTGVFQQTAGSTTVNSDATFFGGTSTVSGGTLNWYTASQPEKSVLNVSGKGTTLNVGDASHTGSITFGTGSSITEEVTTNIYDGSTLNVAGGNVTLSNGLWQGDVSLSGGNLTLSNLNNITGGGTLKATEGNLTLTGTTKLALDEDSSIEEKVVTNIGKESEVYLNQGSLTLDSLDTWEGSVLMAGESTGKLTFDGYDDTTKGMGTLAAFGGEIDILNSSNITLGGDEPGIISENVKTVIDGNSSVTLLEEGLLVLNDDDTWQGTVNLTGGVLDYGVTDPNDVGILKAAKGNLNLLSGSVLNIESPSVVEKAVAVDIQQGATVEVLNGANFTIDSETGDKWHGLVKVKDGTFMTEGMSNRDGIGGKLQQESGSSVFDKGSDILISGTDSFVNGGDISVLNQSRLSFASGNDLTLDDLTVTKDSTFGIMNSLAQTVTATNQFVDDNSNFAMDLNLRNGPSDKFILENLKKADGSTSANVHVSDFGFVGGAPVYRNVDMQLFDVQNLDENVTFSATDKQIMTPIGEYGLTSLGGGKFRASLGRYNPKVFRGQASTLSMYNNQLAINDILLNHVILHSEKNEFGQGRTANRYAAVNPLFAPYQYTQKEGGLWFKSYVDIERLSMTHNLNVNNTAYGTIIGADLPLVNLENGWDFIPTFYIAYNGSNQNYSGVDMYQNGGQGGFMGTFMKNDFIGSVLAYGGGYFNEMNVEGFNDQTGNWFAGTAAKAAYNFHPTKHFIIQPNALISYNAFGKQNWGTDFGVMSMNAGMLNGINVAPGLNLIYGRESWSLYATFQYMYNINDHVGGHAGVDVDLPNLSMRHGYFQYGIGATKTWKDRLNSYFQFVIRNGGRTGVGFQLGLQYLFDWTNFGKHKKSSLPPKKTVLKKIGKK